MKQIGVDEIYLLSEIADKMDLVLPDSEGKTPEAYGREIFMSLFKKLHKARKEVNQLIVLLTEKDPAKMSVKEIITSLTGILKQDGVIDFFK
jgi:Cdc6-like AAA superfamily ATPase